MLFSVVICTYNRADRVGTAVESVLAQTFDDFELIVVDDGSGDHTPEVLARYVDRRLRVVRRCNGGLSAARNTGIAESSGRFVAFLDDDDTVDPGWLTGLARGIDDHTGLTSCLCTFVHEHRSSVTKAAARSHIIYPEVKGMFLAGTFAIDQTVLSDVGGYAEDIRVSHQTELLLRALPVMKARGMTSALINEHLVTIERRPPGDRPLSQPAELLEGAEYMIEHHRDVLAKRPEALADFFAIAGVSATQLGRPQLARCHLRRAATTCPTSPKHLARFGLSLVPPLARRVWRGGGTP